MGEKGKREKEVGERENRKETKERGWGLSKQIETLTKYATSPRVLLISTLLT